MWYNLQRIQFTTIFDTIYNNFDAIYKQFWYNLRDTIYNNFFFLFHMSTFAQDWRCVTHETSFLTQ